MILDDDELVEFDFAALQVDLSSVAGEITGRCERSRRLLKKPVTKPRFKVT
jgi:hypothetical protein